MQGALFVSVVNDTGRALHFIVAVLHFFAPPPHPNDCELPQRTPYEFSLSCPRTSGAGSANCFYDYDFTSDLSCTLRAHLPAPAATAGSDGGVCVGGGVYSFRLGLLVEEQVTLFDSLELPAAG